MCIDVVMWLSMYQYDKPALGGRIEVHAFRWPPTERWGLGVGDDWAKFPTFASHCNSPAKLLGHDLHRGHRAHTLSANNKGEIICRCMWYIAA
jgi:hypothetical protein